MKRRTFILGGLGALGMMAGGGALFVNRPEFGRLPQGARLARMEASPHYVDGQFQNLVPVQVMNEQSGENRFVAMAKFLFGDKSEYGLACHPHAAGGNGPGGYGGGGQDASARPRRQVCAGPAPLAGTISEIDAGQPGKGL